MKPQKLEDLNGVQNWYLKGYVALSMYNIDRLALICAGLTVALSLYPALYLKETIGGNSGAFAGLVLLAATFYLFSRPMGFWIVNPLVGIYGLQRVGSNFGPKTKQKTLEWVFERCSNPKADDQPLDIARLARITGEHK